MNKVSKIKINSKKQKTVTLQQKIDAAQRRKAKMRAETRLAPITVSPARNMNAVYTSVGMLFRMLVLFLGVFGLNLFFCDALKIVILNNADSDNIVLTAGFVALWSLFITVVTMALSLHKLSRALSPIVIIGGAAAYLFSTYSDPLGHAAEAFRRFFNLILENMADAGYTTYMQYITEEAFTYDETELVKFAMAAVIVISGCILALSMAKRVKAPGVVILCAVYMIPVFMFNITRSNKALAAVLIFICGVVALYLFDCIYGGIFASRNAKKEAKKAAKLAKKQAEKDAKASKLNLKNAANTAYNNAITAGMPRSAAKKAREAVYAKDKKEREEREKAEKARVKAEKLAKLEAKKNAKAEKKAAKLAAKEERKKLRLRAAAVKKSKNSDEAAAISQAKNDAKAAAKLARQQKNAGEVEHFKIRAASGFAGGMAMLIAAAALWIPLLAIDKSFPIIETINKPMQLARTYVTAYLMGDDVDLNSLAMYGGVAELNPRNVDFNTPQYTGQKLFSVEADFRAPVYMRSWIGSDYDMETDHWMSAEAEEVVAYRNRFGKNFTPDNIRYFFNKFVYPDALDVQRVNQYRNFDTYGFRTFQTHITRLSGNSRIMFVPSVMNAALGVMEHGSIDKNELKYSAYYDGIYSSRFFNENSQYSVSSFNPVMKAPEIAENMEGAVQYYYLARQYADTIDIIEDKIKKDILFNEEKEYTYDSPLGEIKMTGHDFSPLIEKFEEDVSALGYKYKSQSFVDMYLLMNSGERRQYKNAYDSELNYRDYAYETYRDTFGSDAISDLADRILAEAGIVMGEVPVHDKAALERLSEYQISRLTAEEKYGNYYESWFTDAETGESVPRHNAIMAVINYLRNNYTYTLDPNCPQTELLDEEGNVVLNDAGEPVMVDLITADSNLEAFLFDVKEGYCVHFATSAVALLREMGFAVRYDEGYIASGFSRNYGLERVANYIKTVRDYDAHSWIEIYYPAMGWITYECTPSFCEEMYDAIVEEESNSNEIDQSKVTVEDYTETEEPLPIDFGVIEADYTVLYVLLIALAVLLVILSIAWAIIKVRASRAVEKRRKLVEDSKSELRWNAGDIDIHESARAITDCIFDIFAGLGCPPETGELPTEYAIRIDGDYTDISKHKITDIMAIIEKEEFGGSVTFRELCRLAEYLGEIQSSVYAALPIGQKLRMRYFMNVI